MDKIRVCFISLLACLFFSSTVFADDWYRVENATNSSRFTIGGYDFVAKDYCFGVRTGDKVRFTQGGPGSYCKTAVFELDRNNQTCEVTCE